MLICQSSRCSYRCRTARRAKGRPAIKLRVACEFMRSASASPPPPSSMRILCKVLRCSLLAASIELKLGTRAQTSRSRKPHTPAQTLPASLVLHNFGSFRFRYFFANVHLRSLVLVGLLTSWEGEEEGRRFRPVIVTRCQARSDRARGAGWRKVPTAALRPFRGRGFRRFPRRSAGSLRYRPKRLAARSGAAGRRPGR